LYFEEFSTVHMR